MNTSEYSCIHQLVNGRKKILYRIKWWVIPRTCSHKVEEFQAGTCNKTNVYTPLPSHVHLRSFAATVKLRIPTLPPKAFPPKLRLMRTAVRDAGMCGVLASSWGTSEYVGAQVNMCIHCLSEPQIEYSEYVFPM